ncbi:hypothetical protein ACHAW5_008934 [Stephanodiscus triporus]|uniref:Uncharacterized protein n=1 Tax=Stephanodiscus triporus TaxID=2934178 RepID=A0ABD3MYW6_9STRA
MKRVICVSLLCTAAYAFHPTSNPPLLDVPVFSLSTLGEYDDSSASTATAIAGASTSGGSSANSNGGSSSIRSRSTMNILTYASPVSIKPHRMWCISLYKGTMSHENFARERRGVLQMLRPEHATTGRREGTVGVEGTTGEEEGGLIRALGGSSGRDVDKKGICAEMGYAWERLPEGEEDADDNNWPEMK